MDFGFTEEQQMFSDMTKKFFTNECPMETVRELQEDETGFSKALWKKLADVGLLGVLIDEAYGGMGLDFLDLCPILEEIGKALFPSPFLPTVLMGGTLLSEGAGREVKERILPAIASGDIIGSLGVGETGGEWSEDAVQTVAEKKDGCFVLTGHKLFVPFSEPSDFMICLARDHSLPDKGTTLFLVEADDEKIEHIPMPSFGIDRYYDVRLNGVEVPYENVIGEPGKGWDVIERLLPKIAVARSAEMVGGHQRVLDITVQFVKDREQFGRPIGSLQTIQNYCADIAIALEASRVIAYKAAWKISAGDTDGGEASMAKAWCGDAYRKATEVALQVHGAMGFTEEYDLHFYYKQAKATQLMYGGSSFHRGIVATTIGL